MEKIRIRFRNARGGSICGKDLSNSFRKQTQWHKQTLDKLKPAAKKGLIMKRGNSNTQIFKLLQQEKFSDG